MVEFGNDNESFGKCQMDIVTRRDANPQRALLERKRDVICAFFASMYILFQPIVNLCVWDDINSIP